MTQAMLIVFPTLNQWESTSLIKADFKGKGVAKAIVPFQTAGMETVRTRQVYSLASAQASSIEIDGVITFTAQQAPAFTDYATCFDQYRIRAASVTFSPMLTSSISISTTLYLNPRIWTAFDYDDVNAKTLAQLQSYGSCIEAPPGAGVVRTLIPRISKLAAGSGGTGYDATSEVPCWIDCSEPTIQHYGLKYVIEALPHTQQQYTVDVTLYIEFRSTI